MSQQYVATAKKATAVSKSLVCHFTGADDLNLVIAKGARLEIRDITPEGLQHRLDVPLYGAIATMEAYRLPEESSDRLFILTERYQFCVLQYDGARQVCEIKLGVPNKPRQHNMHAPIYHGNTEEACLPWFPDVCSFGALDECLLSRVNQTTFTEDARIPGNLNFALARFCVSSLSLSLSISK